MVPAFTSGHVERHALEDGELAVTQRHHAGERVGTNGRGLGRQSVGNWRRRQGGGHMVKTRCCPQPPIWRGGQARWYPQNGCDDDRTDGFLVPVARAALRWLAAWLLATLAVLATANPVAANRRRFWWSAIHCRRLRFVRWRRLGRSAD